MSSVSHHPCSFRFALRRSLGVLVVAAALIAGSVPVASGVSSAQDEWLTEAERAEAGARRARQNAIAGELDVLRATDLELQAEANRLAGQIAALESATASAEAELQAAQERSEALNDELDTARTEFTERQRILEQRILQAYMYPRSDTLSAVLAADDLTEAERRRVLADNVAADDRRILAERQAAATELARLEVEVRATADSIEARLAQQESDLDALRAARARADEVAAALDDRIGSFQAEAEGLAASEADLVAIIARRQAAAITTTTTTAPAVTTPPDPDDPTPPTSPPTTAPPVPGGALVWPTQGVLTSPYGWRWGTMHRGIDIGAPSGTPIYAAAGGTVFYAGWMGGYGNLILIDHGDGRVTAYAHQSSLAVSGGQVGRGQVIGYVGSTGDSTGPHLHFELRVDGTAVDPLPYL